MTQDVVHAAVDVEPVYNEKQDEYEVRCLCGQEYTSWGYLAAERIIEEHVRTKGEGTKMLTDQWKKSTKSGAAGHCVEVAASANGQVLVRNSRDRKGAQLTFTPEEWTAFLAGATDGEFDL